MNDATLDGHAGTGFLKLVNLDNYDGVAVEGYFESADVEVLRGLVANGAPVRYAGAFYNGSRLEEVRCAVRVFDDELMRGRVRLELDGPPEGIELVGSAE